MQKSGYLLTSLLIGSTILIGGCSDKKDEAKIEIIKPITSVAEAKTVDYQEAYAPVLEEIRKHFSGSYKNDYDYPEEFTGIMEFLYRGAEVNSHRELGYVIQDISGDDKPELIIGNAPFKSGDYQIRAGIFNVYSYVEGKPKLIISGRSRNYYNLLKDGNFVHYASNGAASDCLGLYKLSYDGTKLDCIDFYFSQSDPKDPATIDYYHNTFGKWEPAVSEKMDVTYSQYWSIYEKWQSNEQVLDYRPMFPINQVDGIDPGIKAAIGNGVDLVDGKQIPSGSGSYEYYQEQNSSYAITVGLHHKQPLKKFKLYRLTNHNVDANGNLKFDTIQVYQQDLLIKPFAARISFPGTMPSYGVSYESEDGGEKYRYYLTMSGEDGHIEATAY